MPNCIIHGAFVLLLAAFAAAASESASRAEGAMLPALGADLGATSVSGLSSGAYMAGQFHIAHSRIVVGTGIIAGGPYACAENAYPAPWKGPGASAALPFVVAGCMLHTVWGVPSIPDLERRVRALARQGRI